MDVTLAFCAYHGRKVPYWEIHAIPEIRSYDSWCAIIGNNVKIQNNVSVYDGVICERRCILRFPFDAYFTNVRNPRRKFPRKGKYEESDCALWSNDREPMPLLYVV